MIAYTLLLWFFMGYPLVAGVSTHDVSLGLGCSETSESGHTHAFILAS